jgi:ectoine hydroxylase-related dioxygenase (phytanoyl-CoA dioxygenase family)
MGYLSADDCRLADLADLVSQKTELADYPYASAVEQNVLAYDGPRLVRELSADAERVEAELARALADGPGVVVIAEAFGDLSAVDRATREFEENITAQRAAGGPAGDHFAQAGQNDRIWNALEKLARRAPEVFAAYYANEILAAACRAWLGPGYQVTSQVNVVNPGGAAQVVHRDYHLGFLPEELAARFPAHAHRLSPVLTLQGAVAHTDMPAETGPTMYLPHSQKYLPGYLAFRRPEFRGYFEAHHVQLPLRRGDAVFFNPALFHAAGANRTAGVRRMANLLQVSSAFGRAMEAVDRAAMSAELFPALLAMRDAGAAPSAVANVIAACAEGYPFPADLDLDQPVDGLMLPAQADILGRAVAEGWSRRRLATELSSRVRRGRLAGGRRCRRPCHAAPRRRRAALPGRRRPARGRRGAGCPRRAPHRSSRRTHLGQPGARRPAATSPPPGPHPRDR